MSGHAWALGRERATRGTGETERGKVGYGPLHLESWSRMFRDASTVDDWDAERAEVRAWSAACPELADYDGFVVTYPPAFAMLYECFSKPIVLDIPVRYDLHFTERPGAWSAFNDLLGEMTADGRLKVVANNAYDAAYYEHFTGRAARRISSTCDYVERLAPKWSPRGTTKLLAFGERAGCRAAQVEVPDVLHVRDVLGEGYLHEELVRARGIVWIPYNASIMSFFEHYWLEIPLFVPSREFLLRLRDGGLALGQIAPPQACGGRSNLPRVGGDMPDPRQDIAAWLPLCDFYDEVEFPHVTYFDSWADLRGKVAGASQDDLGEISARMSVQNAIRRRRNLELWRSVL